MHEHHDIDWESFDWNDMYSGELSDFEPPDPVLLALALDQPRGRALDVGCGAGGLVAALAEAGFDASGIDLSERAIAAARKVLAKRGLDAQVSVTDATTRLPQGPFALITNTFALPIARDERMKVYALMREALAPGGVVLLKDFDDGMTKHSFFAGHEFVTIEELTTGFRGLEILRAEIVDTPVHHHAGQERADENWTAALLHAQKPA